MTTMPLLDDAALADRCRQLVKRAFVKLAARVGGMRLHIGDGNDGEAARSCRAVSRTG